MNKLAFTILVALVSFNAFAQTVHKLGLQHLLKNNKLTEYNRSLKVVNDRAAVTLDERSGEGLVWIKDLLFSEGEIEVDLKGKDAYQKSFLGIAFHGLNDSTYDAIYFRPFNFRAADSVRRIHTVQYISHPTYTWNKLRTEQNGKYEKGLGATPDPNDWFHARIVVREENVDVYLNKSSIPSLSVKKLSQQKNGSVGLWVGNGSGGSFANLTITTKK